MSLSIKYIVTCISKEDPELTYKILLTNGKELLHHLEASGVKYNHLIELVYSVAEISEKEL